MLCRTDINGEALENTDREIEALIAFLHTLTDDAFLSDPRFSDPFVPASAP